MYLLMNMASKAPKRPWQGTIVAVNAQHVTRTVMVHFGEGAVAYLAFTDDQAVLWF